MELNEFVEETLNQIVEGVVKAEEAVKEKGATVNPIGVFESNGMKIISGNKQPTVQMVDFDVVLSVTEAGGKGAKAGIFIGPVGVGANAKSETKSSAMNKVKFAIPLKLPGYQDEYKSRPPSSAPFA